MTVSSFSRGAVFIALCAALTAVGCTSTPPPKEKKPVEVSVTTPIADDVVEYQDFTGRLDAFKTVDLRARVSGYLTEVPFKEGERVKKGQVLFVVDLRPYKAQYDQAVTQIALNEATLQLARATLARDEATGGGAVSPQTIDQDKAAVAEAIARVNSAKATAEVYKLNLDFATVTAPFDGRMSRRFVDPGNDVIADTTLLSTMVTESPVYVYFDVDERTYLDLMKMAKPTETSSFLPQLQSKLLMRLANEEEFTRVGIVNFVDNRVSGTTGTIRVRGEFQNEKRDLRSGYFARVRMPTRQLPHMLLVPDEALLSDQGRKYLYLVNDKNEVEYRSVELGPTVEGLRVTLNEATVSGIPVMTLDVQVQTLRVVVKGLSGSERVVVIGMQRVKPKQVVSVKVQDPPMLPDSPLKKLVWDEQQPK